MRLNPITATIISVICVFVLYYPRPMGFYSDPAWGLRAAQDYLAGKSPSINHCRIVDTGDLSKDAFGWVQAWPPSPQIMFLPFLALGLSTGEAARLVVLAFTLLGCAGWVKWTQRMGVNYPMTIFMAVILPWLRFATLPYFNFSADLFVFALTPWLMLFCLSLPHRQRPGALFLYALAGLCAGLFYLLKWSGLFVTLGVLSWWLIITCFMRPRRFLAASVFSLFCFFPVVAYSLLNAKLGGHFNTLGAHQFISFIVDPRIFIGSFGNIGLSVFDLESLLNFIFLPAARPALIDWGWLGIFGIPFFPLAVWLFRRALRGKKMTPQILLTTCVFVVSWLAVLGLTVTFNGKADKLYWYTYVTRYIRPATLAVMPILLLGLHGFSLLRRKTKVIVAVLIVTYCFIPCVYSITAFFFKLKRVPVSYRAGPTGIYNPFLNSSDSRSVIDEIYSVIRDRSRDVIYVTDPQEWLDIDGRVICALADIIPQNEIKQSPPMITSRPLRMVMVLPKHFENNGKDGLLRSKVPQARLWQMLPSRVDSPANIWFADLE